MGLECLRCCYFCPPWIAPNSPANTIRTITRGVNASSPTATHIRVTKLVQLVAALPINAPEALAVEFNVSWAIRMYPTRKTAIIQTKEITIPVTSFIASNHLYSELLRLLVGFFAYNGNVTESHGNFLNTFAEHFPFMAVVDDYLMLQYLMVFAMSLVFTLLAVERGKIATTLLAGLCWVITALLSFAYAPTVVGSVVAWVFGLFASAMFVGFMYGFYREMEDFKSQRFEVGMF